MRRASDIPQSPPAAPFTEETQMTQTNPILPEVRAGTVSREALVQAALKEITQNYREASLSNVAREYGVSLAYVSECVRAQTGRTYKELLQKHRMETAARLLRRSDMNIQQIISLVGYENTSYFYRLFHERYGQNTGWCAPAMAAPAHKVLALKAGTAAHCFSRKCSSPCFLPFWSILRYFGAGTGFLW